MKTQKYIVEFDTSGKVESIVIEATSMEEARELGRIEASKRKAFLSRVNLDYNANVKAKLPF